ncbi:hypothetical protein HDR58_09880 [bacterium]|nr:hypothetical protein [bacterium]
MSNRSLNKLYNLHQQIKDWFGNIVLMTLFYGYAELDSASLKLIDIDIDRFRIKSGMTKERFLIKNILCSLFLFDCFM